MEIILEIPSSGYDSLLHPLSSTVLLVTMFPGQRDEPSQGCDLLRYKVDWDCRGHSQVSCSCAFSYDISFPTTFYDFDLLDQEYSELSAARESLNCWPELAGRFQTTEALFPWDSKLDVAFFRGR